MLVNYLKNKQKKLNEKNNPFYTNGGLQVFFKDPITNDDVDTEEVIAKVESLIPAHLRTEIDMIIIGEFEELKDRNINAAFKDGAVYVSNIQDDNGDMVDDLIHEISHSLEQPYGYEIYGDQKIKKEFLRKRRYMHDILWKSGFKAPLSFFLNTEFDQEFDDFLYKQVGYDKLSALLVGLFISPYAATSMREYWATAFTDYYLYTDHKTLKKVSPELYSKIEKIQREDLLAN